MPRDKILPLSQVLAILGDSEGEPLPRSTFHDWRAKKCAPRCIKYPNGTIHVKESELYRWLDAREDAA